MMHFGKGDTYRPYDWEKFNKNYDEIFKKNREEKENGTSKKNDNRGEKPCN